MEKMIAGRFADILAGDRDRFNARFAAARAANPALDPAEFADHLRGPVARRVEAVAAIAPARADAAARALYDISLDLFRHDLLGRRARTGLPADAWTDLLPALDRFLTEAPLKTAADVFNALHNLAQESEAAARRWMKRLAELAPACEFADELARVGLVLAWRCGLTHYRSSALQQWTGLPGPLQCRVLGLAPGVPTGPDSDLAKRLHADPWFRPGAGAADRALKIAAVCGGFRGFGGPFKDPPRVSVSGATLVACDSESGWSLHADACGALFKRLPGSAVPPADPERAGVSVTGNGRVTFNGLSVETPELAAVSSFASNAHTLAVTLEHSHYVYVIAALTGDA